MKPNYMECNSSKHTGFTLIEVAIVLAIVGTLLAGGLMAFSNQSERQREKEAQRVLSEINEALIGYVIASTTPRLPCPDTDNNGLENSPCPTGNLTQEGGVPWATLGLAESVDPWGNRYRYRVSGAFSTSITSLTTTGATVDQISIKDAPAGTDLAASSEVVAVVLSHGKNGRGALNSLGGANPLPPLATDPHERANAVNTAQNRTFVSHEPRSTGGAGGEFDDQMIWLSRPILFGRMAQAGKF